MERLNEKETLFILSKMFENNEVKIQIILYIYLSINFKYKLDFKNYRDFKTRINQNSLKEYHEFRKVFSKIGVSVEANEFINNLKVGQVLKLRYVSERNNYHLLQINKLINFLLPFEEIKIPKTFNKYETIEAKIIFICYNKNEVYVSTRQLELNNISFNQNYLKQINIDDIVKCKIRQRFENRITVSINGYSKKQLGVIYKNKNFFNDIKELDAKVINIKNNTIILEPINLIQSQTFNDLSNLTPLTQIKISKNLKQINIDDIVKCKISQRFENRITVSINGYSKEQLGVIYKDKDFFNNIKELDAKVINIENNTIILEPINLIQSQTSNDLSNLPPLTKIKISKNSKQINIDDIVKCKISQRFENRITVSINGYSKEQLGVIYKDKNFFNNIKELDAKVINIENNTIILEPINLVQSQTSNDLSNLPPLTQIKISKTTKWSKIIEYLKRYSINDIQGLFIKKDRDSKN